MKNKKLAAIAGALILLSGFTAACSNDEPEATPPAVEETTAPEAEAPETEVSAEDQQAFTTARGTVAALLVQANVTAIATDGRIDEALSAALTEAIAAAETANESARDADDVVAATAELTAATEALTAARDAAEAARAQG